METSDKETVKSAVHPDGARKANFTSPGMTFLRRLQFFLKIEKIRLTMGEIKIVMGFPRMRPISHPGGSCQITGK